MPLLGANDLLALDARIECLPTLVQCEKARQGLAKRLDRPLNAVGGYYSRGGVDATPLALPELLKFLISRLKRNKTKYSYDFYRDDFETRTSPYSFARHGP